MEQLFRFQRPEFLTALAAVGIGIGSAMIVDVTKLIPLVQRKLGLREQVATAWHSNP